ncbi:MAG: alpha-amylase family glycosyl hydrolase [Rubripirellula sp.]|nr:alpha-amylase family glycosyl hydrolase [Rubripirellula sp.]
MTLDPTATSLLETIYGTVPSVLAAGIAELTAAESVTGPRAGQTHLWSERDVVLITYADQVHQDELNPLAAQQSFLLDHELQHLIDCVHLLPFCPYTTDDGFSVIDYLAVDPESGTWADIAALGEDFTLMFDLVLNHCSQQHEWFQRYLAGDPEYAEFFIDQNPSDDLSEVVRPRSLPLLTQFDSNTGTKHIWTTFSEDQVDLNYANPKVMLAMIRTLVEYARRGARIIRLDAIAFLWKEPGTSCVHLPQTHAAVQLMRYILDRVAPGTLVLTETNVPHDENISYFGNGNNEAHMVYQFSLPPLMLDAIHHADTSILRDWLKDLKPPTDNTTFFNFTASHDGVGVRPLEGIVAPERVERLAEIVCSHGGRVSTRQQSDGSNSPYELNISYLDAVADRNQVPAAEHSRRFLATQAVMLSIQGMPAIYFHSLVGTPNDQAGVETSGQNRRINRHKYERSELESALDNPYSLQRRVFDGYRRLLQVRSEQKAFHPAASMQVIDLPGDGRLAWIRQHGDHQLAVLVNLTDEPKTIAATDVPQQLRLDQLAEEQLEPDAPIELRPFQVRWLTPAT